MSVTLAKLRHASKRYGANSVEPPKVLSLQ